MATDERDAPCIKAFADLGLEYRCKDHAVAMTVEEGLAATADLNCAFAKNLFVRDKKLGLFLLTVTHDRKVDMKVLPTLLGLSAGGANFRFAADDILNEKLAVKQGSVTPLSVMNDTAGDVTFVLDSELAAASLIGVHPQRNDKTITMTPDELTKVSRARSLYRQPLSPPAPELSSAARRPRAVRDALQARAQGRRLQGCRCGCAWRAQGGQACAGAQGRSSARQGRRQGQGRGREGPHLHQGGQLPALV